MIDKRISIIFLLKSKNIGYNINGDIMKDKVESEIIYFDENKNIVSKEKAVSAVIRELDENGKLIREIWGDISNEPDEEW